jgi:hypothetical protein
MLAECERVLTQVICAPQRRDLTKRIEALQAQLDAALAADDFEAVALLCSQLQILQQQSAQLPLSEEGYLTLLDRHAALVQKLADKCKELAEAKDYAAVTSLGVKLSELRAATLSAVDCSETVRRHAGSVLCQCDDMPLPIDFKQCESCVCI